MWGVATSRWSCTDMKNVAFVLRNLLHNNLGLARREWKVPWADCCVSRLKELRRKWGRFFSSRVTCQPVSLLSSSCTPLAIFFFVWPCCRPFVLLAVARLLPSRSLPPSEREGNTESCKPFFQLYSAYFIEFWHTGTVCLRRGCVFWESACRGPHLVVVLCV